MAVEGLLEGERRHGRTRLVMLAMLAMTPLVLEPALSNGARSFSRFAVSRFRFLRRQLITPRAAESARAAGDTPWAWRGGPHPLMTKARPSPSMIRGAKIYPTKNSRGD